MQQSVLNMMNTHESSQKVIDDRRKAHEKAINGTNNSRDRKTASVVDPTAFLENIKKEFSKTNKNINIS